MRFWDTSALLPLIVNEPRTANTLAMINADSNVVVSFITPVEVACAVSRRTMHAGARIEAEDFVTRLRRSWTVIDDYDAILVRAESLGRKYQLRGADAVQLASAVQLRGTIDNLAFVTLDQDLAAAARAEGFPVLP